MLFARMLRAARFDASVYEELRQDPVAYAQALVVLGIALVAMVIGAATYIVHAGGSARAAGLALIDPLALWMFPSMSLFVLGGLARVNDPKRGSDRDLLIAIGFASSPGVLWLLPYPAAAIVVWGWVMASMIVAAKAMLGINFFKALAFVLPGVLVYWLMITLIALLFGKTA